MASSASPSAPTQSIAVPGKSPLRAALPQVKVQQHGIAHRMADDIGVAIVNGELADGARIL